MTKNHWLTIEMVLRHAFEVATHNAVESKTARSRHGIEVATYISEKGKNGQVATKNRKLNGNC